MIGDLAEAALHAGRVEEARARLAEIEAAAGDNPTVWIALGLRHARALLAADEQADEGFEEALGADLRRWPFQRARLLLAHGQWLRRHRRITESRAPLRDARDAFDALGCAAFSQHARRELRASGESSRRRDPAARDQLTAQELQIAAPRRRRPLQPRDRPTALRLPPHDRHAPLPDLPEARNNRARRARPRFVSGRGAAATNPAGDRRRATVGRRTSAKRSAFHVNRYL